MSPLRITVEDETQLVLRPTRFSFDISAFSGQTIRIDLDLQVQMFYLDAFTIDDFRLTDCRGSNQPPTVVTANQADTLHEGQTATNGGTVSDPDGNPVTLTASVGTVINNNDGTWSWSFGTSDGPDQTQLVTIDADDGNGGTAQTTFNLIVNNVSPTASLDNNGPVDEGSSATIFFSGTYVPSSVDTPSLHYTFDCSGGWINSPAGAYAAEPSFTGKASFGFVAKYKPGASTPSGNTEFQFKAGELNFKSASYEWLVVSAAHAKYKGEGTINGGGSYGFMLTAIDGDRKDSGDPDEFRIKIWDLSSGAVVYDNKMGDADDAPSGTALGGGSIVIHR